MTLSPVFLDTVGVLAVWDRSDQWHAPAAQVFADLTRQRVPLIATTCILLECGNAAARRPYRTRVNFLRTTLVAQGLLIEPTAEDIEQAWQAYHRGEAGQAGIVDHISFVVMRRLGLTSVFTNDHHFHAAGFITLF